MPQAVAVAHPNIALVKYWGKRNLALNLPAVPSLSLTVDQFVTRTEVTPGDVDVVLVDDAPAPEKFARKVTAFLDKVDPKRPRCRVRTSNNFPAGAGLASSSSGFAALALAAAAAFDQDLDPTRLSVLARQGSGSACRSLWGGFVEWQCGTSADGTDSHGIPVASGSYWPLALVVAVVSSREKAVSSTEGMERTRATSPWYAAFVRDAPADVDGGRAAVLARDLPALGLVMEQSTFKMHGTMQTSAPPLLYWQPGTVACLHAVWALRARGVSAWVTMDAGPNVKILCAPADTAAVSAAIAPHVERVHVLGPGEGAHLV